jgi:tetratricopeptide (TPR) repeat protein
MRASTGVFLVGLALAASSARSGAQQPPRRPDLDAIASLPSAGLTAPAAQKGSELERALKDLDYERAEKLLAAQIERTPNSPELLKTIASVFLMDRKPLNAAIALKKAEALAPLDRESRFRLVLAYIAMKRGDWARPELERLAAAEPSTAIYQYWLGRLDYDDRHYESAIGHLRQSVTLDPTFSRAFDNLGLCYEALNQPEQAMAPYREAIRLNREAADKSPWPPLNFGILLRTRGELTEAEALFREALTYNDHFAVAHYQLGALLEQTDRADDAVKSLRKAAEIDPAYAEPYYALARIYRRLGRVAEADAALATFQRLREPHRDTHP